MARTKLILDQKRLNQLKEMAEAKFGQSITTSRDCVAFTNELEKSTGELLSIQTIRRFFGLIEAENIPSIFTLNVIAKYVGQKDWKRFCLEKVLSNPVSDYDVNGIIDFYTDYQFGNEKVIDKVINDEVLRSTLLPVISNTPMGAKYFFEERPLRDYLCTDYANSLKNYLKTKNYSNEACLFTYGLLFIGAFLSEDKLGIEKYYSKIKNIEITEEIYNIPVARKFGVELMYYHLNKDEWRFEQIFNEAIAIRINYIAKMEYSYNNFDFTLIEHLMILERYHECKILVDLHLGDKLRLEGSELTLPNFYRQVYNLGKGITYYHNNLKKEGRLALKSLEISFLRSGERAYYNLLYLLFQLEIVTPSATKKRAHLINQINQLIEKTGYVWYKNQLNRIIG